MPQISTDKETAEVKRADEFRGEEPDDALLPRIKRARRRLNEHYYDRPEVRRTIAGLVLRRFLQISPK